MNIRSTKCCGLNEIDGLNGYNNPEDALIAFCESQMESNNKYNSEVASVKSAICSHYFFTAAVMPSEIKKDGGISVSNYGIAFARYIQTHDLGTVVATPCVINEAWHPDHSVMAWLWTPDYLKLRSWYVNRRGGRMVQRLTTIVSDLQTRLKTAESAFNRCKKGHYLYAHYETQVKMLKDNLLKAEKDLKKAKKEAA